MTISSTFTSATAPVRSLAGPGTMLHQFILQRQRARAQRQEVARITRELRAYSDRQLADLGMNRSDIPDVAHGFFRAG